MLEEEEVWAVQCLQHVLEEIVELAELFPVLLPVLLVSVEWQQTLHETFLAAAVVLAFELVSVEEQQTLVGTCLVEAVEVHLYPVGVEVHLEPF